MGIIEYFNTLGLFMIVISLIIGILILQAGQKLRSGRLQLAGFLMIILSCLIVTFYLSLFSEFNNAKFIW